MPNSSILLSARFARRSRRRSRSMTVIIPCVISSARSESIFTMWFSMKGLKRAGSS